MPSPKLCAATSTPSLSTVGIIADRLGVKVHRVAYLVKVLGIRPLGRAGRLRVFAEADIGRIASALGRDGAEGVRS